METQTETKVFAGNPTQTGNADGHISTALFSFVESIHSGPDGDLLVVDNADKAIRHITRDGIVSTVIDKSELFAIGSPDSKDFIPTGVPLIFNAPTIATFGPNREIISLLYRATQLLIFEREQIANVITIPRISAMTDSYQTSIRYFHITPSNRILITTAHSIFFVDGEMLYDIRTWNLDKLLIAHRPTNAPDFGVLFNAAITDDNGILWIIIESLIKVVAGHCVNVYYLAGLGIYGLDAITIAPDGRIFYIGSSNRFADSNHTVIGVFNPISETSEILCECNESYCAATITIRGNSLYVPHGPCILQVDV